MTTDEPTANRDSTRIFLVGYLVILFVGSLHRGVLFYLYFDDLRHLVRTHRDWLTWQYLSVPALSDHFWSSILYLQQTPPIPNMILGAFMHVFGWPFGVAYACIVLQAGISIASAMLLFRLLCRLTRPSPAWCAVALVFLLSSDLLILEYNSLGQTFYENHTMLLLLLLVDAFGRRRSAPMNPRIPFSLVFSPPAWRSRAHPSRISSSFPCYSSPPARRRSDTSCSSCFPSSCCTGAGR